MDPGKQTTGTRDEHYNLISVLYHALHGAENCEIYAADADAAGRDDQVAFFREAQAAQRQMAERAKGLLGIAGAPRAGGVTPGTAGPGTELPPEGIVRSESPTPPRDIRRGTSPEPLPRSGFMTEPSPRPGEDVPPPGDERPSESDRDPPPPRLPPDSNTRST